MSFFQTLSLRFNPIIEKAPTATEVNISNLPFGSAYKGKQKVWTVVFNSESELGVGIDDLAADFEFVPIVTGLDETVNASVSVFRTHDPKNTNLYFEVDDK